MYNAKMIADSINEGNHRLSSMEVRYPHGIHKDIMTHCILERNFLSFRAWPTEKVIDMAENHWYEPEIFYKRAKGMGQGNPLPIGSPEDIDARYIWRRAKDSAVENAKRLNEMDIDKGQINTLLQDYCWITGLISATEWDNFFALRAFAPEGAKPRKEVEKIARVMYDVREASTPTFLEPGEWHLPYVTDEEKTNGIWGPNALRQISSGRTARLSYLTHNGVKDPLADMDLSNRLISSFHMSPFGHQATPLADWSMWNMDEHGKFTEYVQYRKQFENEGNAKLALGLEF